MAFLLEARILTDNLDLVRLVAVGKLSSFLLPLSSSLFCIFHSSISLHIVSFFYFSFAQYSVFLCLAVTQLYLAFVCLSFYPFSPYIGPVSQINFSYLFSILFFPLLIFSFNSVFVCLFVSTQSLSTSLLSYCFPECSSQGGRKKPPCLSMVLVRLSTHSQIYSVF